ASLAATLALLPARSIISTPSFVSITSARALNGPSEIVKVNVADPSGQPLKARSRFEPTSSMFTGIWGDGLHAFVRMGQKKTSEERLLLGRGAQIVIVCRRRKVHGRKGVSTNQEECGWI